MPDALNPRQSQILEFLREHAALYAFPPTVREIGRAVGLNSSSTVQSHLNALETKGRIRRDATKSRTVSVIKADDADSSAAAASRDTGNIVRLPLVGRVAAGRPILADENVEDHVSVGLEIAGGEESFALTVSGDSMINAGINDGDIVVVRPGPGAPSNGTIVVARIENPATGESEVTVKRFYKEVGHIRLQPENDSFEPLHVHDLNIEGVVVAVIRILR